MSDASLCGMWYATFCNAWLSGTTSAYCSKSPAQHYPMSSPLAKYLHCVRTACILRTQRPGYSPKNTCHLTGCTAKQQSPHENDETAFNLVLHCPYEQTTQPRKVRLLRVFRCPWLRSWKRMRCPLTRSAGNALSVVSWVMGTANRVKGRAVVILSVDTTHLLMASDISDVVGMKAVPQTPQGPRAMYGSSPLPSRGLNSGESSIWGMENGLKWLTLGNKG